LTDMTDRETGSRTLTARFREALWWAAFLHADQARKGSGIPYVSHLLAVTALVIEHGGDEDAAIAALLHDAAEDQGGEETLEQIRTRYGQRVASIVEACSDTMTSPKPPWRERKERYIAHLAHVFEDVLLVSMADKLHNARAIRSDYQTNGEAVWGRFRGGRSGTLWYYQALCEAFVQRGSFADLARELRAEVDELLRLVDGNVS
jgi:(p)ppGpp synthase/HD superfamily hydrolase